MTKISKILVANRGEIAVRIMRTAKQMGYATVAVYSDADKHALHVECADESVHIGASPAGESYLLADKIINAAKMCGADAIHPGYGFLSENAEFADACAKAKIVFVGPPAQAIRLMGSKRLSKLAMLQSKVPCIAGYQGEQQGDKILLREAKKIGFPLMIKASAGGGGRGMRLVFEQKNLQTELNMARGEALSAFGSDEVILERALIEPRHIEIQVFADTHGNVVYLGERDCSIQRRHQKVVEESPSPFVDAALRQRMGEAAVSAARACDYVGAGTVEFLVDANQDFYFLEMNTRLQVEHPVTEMVTGQDLVAWQLHVAAGNSLPLTQDYIGFSGHAIEVRLYAEDPRQNFMPQTGKILSWQPSNAKDVRNDVGIKEGQEVSPFYDPLLAKIIAWGETRDSAISKLRAALHETVLLGVNNNKHFLRSALGRDAFRQGDVTTAFLEQQFPDAYFQEATPSPLTLAVAAMLFYRQSQLNTDYLRGEWSTAVIAQSQLLISLDGQDFSVACGHSDEKYLLSTADQQFEFIVERQQPSAGVCQIILNGMKFSVSYACQGDTLQLEDERGHYAFTNETYRPASAALRGGDGLIKAPMDGAVVEISVKAGETVSQGQVVAVLEAMKMAHQLKASVAGTVTAVKVAQGQQVKTRQVIMQITESE